MPDPMETADRSAPGVRAIGPLLDQFQQTLQALTELMTALRTAAQRPPVHMEIASMAVERLDFQLPAIDVESLSGELNVGITHRLSSPAGPKPPPPSQVQPESAHVEPAGRQRSGGSTTPAAERPAETGGAALAGLLPHSPVSRWLAAGRPRREGGGEPVQTERPAQQTVPVPPVRPAVRSIWPPDGREGEPMS